MSKLIILAAVMLAGSILFSRRKWYAPGVLVSGMWLACLVAYSVLDKGCHPLHKDTLEAIGVWLGAFCVTGWCVQSLRCNPLLKQVEPGVQARDLYYYISLFTLPYMVWVMLRVIAYGGGNPFDALRVANVENVRGIQTTSFVVVFWIISYLMELCVVSKNNRGRIVLLAGMNVFYAFLSMSKMNFMILFLCSLIILFEKKVIKWRHIVVCTVMLVGIFYGVQEIRGSGLDPKTFVATYMASSMANLDQHVKAHSSELWGENTFRFVYAIRHAMDATAPDPVNVVYKFEVIHIGSLRLATNTFTALYPYYKDFGLTGVWVAAILLGWVFGFLFKAGEEGSMYAYLLYAIYSGCLVMQVIGDTVMTVLSQNIQYLLIALIPFLISKYRLFENSRFLGKTQ